MGSDGIKISVVLPVYNVEPYIGRCIKSLRDQTLADLEFIFVDDCSAGSSMAAVEVWAAEDERVHILRNDKNVGSGPTRNRGIEAARGDYLSFVDPDDYMAPDFYELLYTAAAADGGHDIAKGRCCCVDAESGEVGAASDAQNNRIREGLAAGKPLYRLLTYEHWTCLWKRALFDNPDVCYGTSAASQDTTFQLRACYQTNDIAIEDKALYFYVQRPYSATHHSLVARTYGELDTLAEKIAFLRKQGMDEQAIAYLKARVKTFLKRFQAALGSGQVGREMIAPVVKGLDEMLRQGTPVKGGNRMARKLAGVVPDHRLVTPGLRANGEGKVRVSVVLPVCNVECGIGRCIESLRAQLLDGLEFIFVDDCSTDASMAAVEQWAAEDERVRILRNEKNLGAGPSCSRGIQEARGDYLSFVDPTGYVSPGFYELLYAAAVADGGHDIAKGLRETVEQNGTRSRSDSMALNQRIRHAKRRKEPLFSVFTCSHQAAIYRRTLTEEGARFGTSRHAQDTTFLLTVTLRTEDITFEEGAVYSCIRREGPEAETKTLQRFSGELDVLAEKAAILEAGADRGRAERYLQEQTEVTLAGHYQDAADGLTLTETVSAYRE